MLSCAGLESEGEDIEFLFKNCKEVDQIAAVRDRKWESVMAKMDAALSRGREKYLHVSERDEARNGVTGG